MTAYKQAYGEHYTHEVVPFAEIFLVRSSKADTSWSARRKNVGTRVTQCSSRVFGLVEVICRTNTSFSHLEVVYFRERFDNWNLLVDTMLDFSIK